MRRCRRGWLCQATRSHQLSPCCTGSEGCNCGVASRLLFFWFIRSLVLRGSSEEAVHQSAEGGKEKNMKKETWQVPPIMHIHHTQICPFVCLSLNSAHHLRSSAAGSIVSKFPGNLIFYCMSEAFHTSWHVNSRGVWIFLRTLTAPFAIPIILDGCKVRLMGKTWRGSSTHTAEELHTPVWI